MADSTVRAREAKHNPGGGGDDEGLPKRWPIIAIHGPIGSGKDTVASILLRFFPDFRVRRFATPLRDAIQVLTVGAVPASKTETHAHKAAPVPTAAFGKTRAEIIDRVHQALCYATDTNGPHTAFDLPEKEFDERLGRAADVLQAAMPMTIGRLLQVFGTDVARRLFSPRIWVKAFEREWRGEGSPPIIVPDLRFPEELALVYPLGARLLWVDADERLAARALSAGSSPPPRPRPWTKGGGEVAPPPTGAAGARSGDGRDLAHSSEGALEKQRCVFERVPNNGSLTALEHHVLQVVIPVHHLTCTVEYETPRPRQFPRACPGGGASETGFSEDLDRWVVKQNPIAVTVPGGISHPFEIGLRVALPAQMDAYMPEKEHATLGESTLETVEGFPADLLYLNFDLGRVPIRQEGGAVEVPGSKPLTVLAHEDRGFLLAFVGGRGKPRRPPNGFEGARVVLSNFRPR